MERNENQMEPAKTDRTWDIFCFVWLIFATNKKYSLAGPRFVITVGCCADKFIKTTQEH
jgi:hypothetical protein